MRILKIIPLIFVALNITSCENQKNHQSLEKINTQKETIKKLETKNQELEKDYNILKDEYSILKKGNQAFNENFLSFVINFSENEEFQKERIEFPIKIEESYIGENDTIYTRTKENWDFKKYEFHPEGFNIYDNRDLKLRKSNYRVLRWYGIESEGDLRFYFKGKDGKWFLYKISHSG